MTPARAIEILRDMNLAGVTHEERAEAFALAVRRLSLPRGGKEYSVEIQSRPGELIRPGCTGTVRGRPQEMFKPCYLTMLDPAERWRWSVRDFQLGQRLQDVAFIWDGGTSFDTAHMGQDLILTVTNLGDTSAAFDGRFCGVTAMDLYRY